MLISLTGFSIYMNECYSCEEEIISMETAFGDCHEAETTKCCADSECVEEVPEPAEDKCPESKTFDCCSEIEVALNINEIFLPTKTKNIEDNLIVCYYLNDNELHKVSLFNSEKKPMIIENDIGSKSDFIVSYLNIITNNYSSEESDFISA